MTSAPPPAPPSTDPPPAWQPPPAGPPVRTQLRRSRTDKMLGGVSGGLAEYSGVDALLWRVGFVALALAGGSGVIVYLLLWLLMPAGPRGAEPAGATTATAPAVRAPAGPRSPVPGMTIAGLLILTGALVLVAQLADVDLGPRIFLGSALLLVGLGLIAAAFSSGRTARGGLIALGVVLSLALVTVSTEPWEGADHGIGDQTFVAGSAGEVRSNYHGGIGDLTIDLSDVDVADLDRTIRTRVDAGVGDVDVILPRDADVRVSVDSGVGTVDVFDEGNRSGFFEGSGSGSWVDDGEAEIDLFVNAGIGDVEVSRG